MLAEAIKAIGELTEQSLKIDVREHDRFKDHLLIKPDGSSDVIFGDAPSRKHHAGSFRTLQALIEKYSDDAEVWYNRAGVTIVFDATTYRRNIAHLELELSPEVRRLAEISGKPFTQSEIIKLLRIHFKCCDFGQTVTTLRNVKFEINQDSMGSIERTKVSVGKSQLARIYGLDALQEELTFTVPVFASKFREFFTISAALDPDPEAKTFTITPYPGQIEAAILEAEEKIGLQLEAMVPEGVRCFLGKP